MNSTTASTNTAASTLNGIFANAIEAPVRIAAALASALTKTAAAGPLSALATAAGCSCASGGSSCSCHAGCCEIPPPCWEPQPLGSCVLEATPGSSATIRVRVTNCGWTRQVVKLTALGRLSALMTFTPTAIVLEPQEGATMLVVIHVPTTALLGRSLTAPLIIRGCRDHFARITLVVGDCIGPARNCCEVVVNDCADNIHHWYDHFYCPRPCHNVRYAGRGVTTAGKPNG